MEASGLVGPMSRQQRDSVLTTKPKRLIGQINATRKRKSAEVVRGGRYDSNWERPSISLPPAYTSRICDTRGSRMRSNVGAMRQRC
jgi:hypothetical protein